MKGAFAMTNLFSRFFVPWLEVAIKFTMFLYACLKLYLFSINIQAIGKLNFQLGYFVKTLTDKIPFLGRISEPTNCAAFRSRALGTKFPISFFFYIFLFCPFFLTNLRKISYSRAVTYFYIYSVQPDFSVATMVFKIAYVFVY